MIPAVARQPETTLNEVLRQERRKRAMVQFIFDGDPDAEVTILLAHGAGAPMDSASMNAASASFAAQGFRVARFEFGYMAARRTDGTRKPPPKAETLNPEYIKAIDSLSAKGPVIIGGKSMGGRVASMIADELRAAGRIAGLLCLGYPFHPPGKPESLRTRHLENLQTPALIIQGTRDEFGTRTEVATYQLSRNIRILWLEDGDHDLKPRKSISGFTAADHMKTMATTVGKWAGSIVPITPPAASR
jgi:predicted alpha/beta-hydrolase family hydrolase